MTDVNVVVLVGRLTRDMELKYLTSGTAVGNFSIACSEDVKQGDKWEEKAHFFDCVLWGKRAESLKQYMTKGKQVAVGGRLRQETWQNKEGQNRSKIVVNVERLQLLGGASVEGEGARKPASQSYKESGQFPHPNETEPDEGFFGGGYPF